MSPAQAISIVAQQLARNAIERIDWEDVPDIGMYDWDRVAAELDTMVPQPHAFNEAMALLEQRAGKRIDDE